jgi:hypothetical protein
LVAAAGLFIDFPKNERPLVADIVEKVENRATPKISQKLILRHIDGCNAPQR